jgi:putative two-component system response regulator
LDAIYEEDGAQMNSKKKLLIVDVSETDRAMIAYSFKDSFTILETNNSFDAVSIFMKEKNDIALIFLDIYMPIMNGIEVLQKIRTIDAAEETPVILIAAEAIQDDVLKGYEYGISDFIVKPCPPKELQSRVLPILNGTRRSPGKALSEAISSSSYDLAAIQAYDKKLLICLRNLYEARKVESFNHLKRISLYTACLLKALVKSKASGVDLNEEQIELISRASVYHDIGKLTIPDDILKNARALNSGEQQIYNKHTDRGAEILSINNNPNMEYFVNLAVEIAQCHHEKWDGSGFPNALVEEQIPFSAQVVGIALDFDRLTKYSLDESQDFFKVSVQKMMSMQGMYNPIVLRALARSETIFTKIALKYIQEN